MNRVALDLQDAHDLRESLKYVRNAEEKGFEAVWQAESRLVRDAIVLIAAYAAVTEHIKVGLSRRRREIADRHIQSY